MPKPFYTTIAGVKLNYRQQTIISTLAKAGISSTKIQKALQDEGIGLRRQSILNVQREILGQQKKQETWKNIPKKYAPAKESHTIARKPIDTEYQYTVKVNTFSGILEKENARYVVIKTDRRMTIQDLFNTAEEELIENNVFDGYREEVTSYTLQTSLRRS